MKTAHQLSVFFRCPACDRIHESRPEHQAFNFDDERPTLEIGTVRFGVEVETPAGGTCRSFIRDGMISYSPESNHHLAGKTVELPDLTDADFE